MTVTDEYLENNKRYAETFSGPLPLPPSRHVAVVACMDARLDVYRILGLGDGEAHVIRNAGGVVTDDAFKRAIQDETGIKPNWSAEAFPDVEEDVRQSLRRVASSPFVTLTESLRGFVFDVATGRLTEVGDWR
ncbi:MULTISPECIES: carbonic anhydrase [unclassified Rhodococcus (in: high G+C Gram-positive bacteria)]|uniref:carbonic anhydrase n=1 Tax=unclassified Rhodococcus (in: high G+C Gram-positive bacteria) TaxID=192944 RepID=UPI000E0BD5E2|nr:MULTISPECIES: carbonic anhydrase [unclassified Rhodococcus (in: high G+C Gram-positive bacteria)]QKT13345.1 carbonic anhydrase [Rhodococcus sp. W8901]RDI14692.1 carbonic anhydrase [Rhodococcus sp. AG1013]